MADRILWGIRAGQTGAADTLFRQKNQLALGWSKVGDLGRLANDREAFKAAVLAAYPDKKPGAVANNAGQLYRFVHEVKLGDLVAYPSKQDREINLGKVAGPYVYGPNQDAAFPHLRAVEWIRSIPRTHFSQGALYEAGSAMTLFQIRNYAEEFLAAIEGRNPLPVVQVDTDASVAEVAEDVEETTNDFILKTLAQELKGHPLAHFVSHLLNTMGYRTRVSPEGPDGGIDIIAHKDELGFEPPIIKVQVKSTEGRVGDPEVSALYGKVGTEEYGLLVTLGSFTPPAKQFARSKSNLRLIDGDDLVALVLEHYEKFESKYKSLLPLKRVYIPEPRPSSDE